MNRIAAPGARIADRRKAFGLLQEELAHRIGIGRQSLSAIENGGSFRAQTLDSLAVELEVSADFIMYGAGSTKAELVADANVVLTRQNCRVNTVGNSSMTIYNKHVLERARHESEGAGALQYEIVKEIIYYE